jgi:hypothetical protein
VGGHDLVALIFAREISDPLTSLVKKIDSQLQESSARRKSPNKLGVHVVFCSDDPNLPAQLENLISREGLQNVVISVSNDRAQGPSRYRVSREAELTVVVYRDRNGVVANHVLASVDLTTDRVNDILQSLRSVLP